LGVCSNPWGIALVAAVVAALALMMPLHSILTVVVVAAVLTLFEQTETGCRRFAVDARLDKGDIDQWGMPEAGPEQSESALYRASAAMELAEAREL
jgi:hypothetical protein